LRCPIGRRAPPPDSLFTDISSEMVASILPLYLVLGIGLSPVRYGVIDGLYQGVTAPVRLLSGMLGDRWRRHKEIAVGDAGPSPNRWTDPDGPLCGAWRS
jgi:hypothetical protein